MIVRSFNKKKVQLKNPLQNIRSATGPAKSPPMQIKKDIQLNIVFLLI